MGKPLFPKGNSRVGRGPWQGIFTLRFINSATSQSEVTQAFKKPLPLGAQKTQSCKFSLCFITLCPSVASGCHQTQSVSSQRHGGGSLTLREGHFKGPGDWLE